MKTSATPKSKCAYLGHYLSGSGHHQGPSRPVRPIVGSAPAHCSSARRLRCRGQGVGGAGARGGGHADNSRSNVTVLDKCYARYVPVAHNDDARGCGRYEGRGRMFLRVCLVHWPRFVSSSDDVSYADHRRLPVHWSDDGSGVRVSHDGWPGGRVPLHLCTTR